MKSNLGYISCTREPPQPMDYKALQAVTAKSNSNSVNFYKCQQIGGHFEIQNGSDIDNDMIYEVSKWLYSLSTRTRILGSQYQIRVQIVIIMF